MRGGPFFIPDHRQTSFSPSNRITSKLLLRGFWGFSTTVRSGQAARRATLTPSALRPYTRQLLQCSMTTLWPSVTISGWSSSPLPLFPSTDSSSVSTLRFKTRPVQQQTVGLARDEEANRVVSLSPKCTFYAHIFGPKLVACLSAFGTTTPMVRTETISSYIYTQISGLATVQVNKLVLVN